MKHLLKHKCQDAMTGEIWIEYRERGGPARPEVIDDFIIEAIDQFENGTISAEAVKERLHTLLTFALIEEEEYLPLLELLERMKERKTLTEACLANTTTQQKRI